MRIAEELARVLKRFRARVVIGRAHDDDRRGRLVDVGLHDEIRAVEAQLARFARLQRKRRRGGAGRSGAIMRAAARCREEKYY